MTGATYSFGVPCGGQASKGHATRSERLVLAQGARKIGGEPHITASGTETAGASHSIARAVPAECAHGTHSVSRSPAIFRGLPQRAPGLRRWSVADLVWGRLTKRGPSREHRHFRRRASALGALSWRKRSAMQFRTLFGVARPPGPSSTPQRSAGPLSHVPVRRLLRSFPTHRTCGDSPHRPVLET